MGRFKGLLKQFEFHLLALVLVFLFLSWPLISVFEHEPPGTILAYLFLIWTILIVLLILTTRSISTRGE